MDYIVSASLQLDDKASRSLQAVIGKIELLQKAFVDLEKLLGSSSKMLADMGIIGKTTADSFTTMNSSITGISTKLTNMGAAGTKAATGLDAVTVASADTAFNVDTVALAAERASVAMKGMAASSVAASRASKFGMGGAGGRGGGRHGSGIMGNEASFLEGAGLGGGLAHMGGKMLNAGIVAMIGEQVAESLLHPSMEYAQKKFLLGTTGLTPQQVGQAEAMARQTVKTVPTATLTGSLETTKEMYGMFGDFNRALRLTPQMQMLKAAFVGASSGMPQLKGQEENLAQVVIKAAEMTGHQYTDKDLMHFSNMLLKSYISSGQLSNPQTFAQVIKYARGGKYGKSDDFLFGVMPYIIQEMSVGSGKTGGSRGIGPMLSAIDRAFVGGIMPKSVIPLYQQLGILAPGSVKTTTPGSIATGKIMDKRWVTDPFEAITGKDGMLDKFLKHMHKSRAEFEALDQAGKKLALAPYLKGLNSTLQDTITNFVINERQARVHIEMMRKAADMEKVYSGMLQQTSWKMQEVNVSFENLLTTLGLQKGLIFSLNTGLDGINHVLRLLNDTANAWPKMSQDLMTLNPGIKQFGDEIGSVAKVIGDALNWIGQQIVNNADWIQRLGIASAKGIAGAAVGTLHNPITGGVTGGLEGWNEGWKSTDTSDSEGTKRNNKMIDALAKKQAMKGYARGTSRIQGGILVPPPPPGMPLLNQLQQYPALPTQHAFPGSVPIKHPHDPGHKISMTFNLGAHSDHTDRRLVAMLKDSVTSTYAKWQLMHNATTSQANSPWTSNYSTT